MTSLETWIELEASIAKNLCRGGQKTSLMQACPIELTRHIDADGLRLAALLVARLRFERIQQASRTLGVRFQEDPEALVASFKSFHESVPMDFDSPWEDARAFEAWVEKEL